MCSSKLNDGNHNDKTQPNIIQLNFVFVLPMLVSIFPCILTVQVSIVQIGFDSLKHGD